jgi:hypothetical protein
VTDFSGYLCWTPTVAAATLATEAVSPSAAVFFATHAPLRIYRHGGNESQREAVSEEEVRRDFLGRPTANGILLLPVVGQSGTGKSHLVRWVKEKTESTERRKVIYLPKSRTSLKAVVETLLADVRSEKLDQLRHDVAQMSSELDQAGLEQRVINQLQEALARAVPEPGPARILAGPRGLAVLLLDPHVREYLLRPQSLIPQLVASQLKDQAEGVADRPDQFTIDDLPLDILDPGKSAEVTQKLLMLIKARPELQNAAVKMLNEQLSVAMMNAANIGVGRLQNAMLDIRREFASQGQEIVLLIEDFALIQGIQRDLLDAIIEVGERDGQAEFAPVRTLMAVTTGYYRRLAETVLTRARAATPYVYDLDSQFDPDRGMEETVSFVARYLNAARMGRDRLDEEGVRVSDKVPNKCDGCRFGEECHQAFGSSADGFGTYPFNEPALRRAIRARPVPGNPNAFNPRAIIGEVVRNVLVEYAAQIQRGDFPGTAFRRDYPTAPTERTLSASTLSELERVDPGDAARRATFLEFWGDAPDDVVNLSPVLHDAFAISLLDLRDIGATAVLAKPTPARSTPDTAPPPGPVPSDLPRSTQQMIHQLDDWATRNEPLPQQTASKIRGIIQSAVVRRCSWDDPLMPEPVADVIKRAWPVGSTVVSIDRAGGENREASAGAPIQFSRDASTAVFFQGLLRAEAGQTRGTGDALRELARLSDAYQADLRQAVLRVLSVGDEHLASSVRASLIGAALSGTALPGMTEAELLTAVLDDGRNWARGDTAICVPDWIILLARHRDARPDLVNGLLSGFGLRRGTTGSEHMVDAARVLPLLRIATRDWQWLPPAVPVAPWLSRAVLGFAAWDSLVERQIDSLTAQLDQVRVLLPTGTRLTDTINAVRAAVTAAVEVGHGPLDRQALEALIDRVARLDSGAVELLQTDLAKAGPPDATGPRARARIAAAARDRGADLKLISDFLQASDKWLKMALHDISLREGGAAVAAGERVQEMLRQWARFGEEGQE